jgi:hypothetical protein
MLTIESYEAAESAALGSLSARAIEAFGPVTFNATNYPTRVRNERELLRYADAMHETKGARYFKPPYLYSRQEADLVGGICDAVANFTESQHGKRVRPWMAPLAAVHPLRAIVALVKALELRSPSVFELGPGSGYLGAALIRLGYRYASMDNTQCFYLWQNRLYQHLAGNSLRDLASDAGPDATTEIGSQPVVHMPWWHFVGDDRDQSHRADVVVSDHALGEMSRLALRYLLRTAHDMLAGDGPKLFFFTSPGASFVSDLAALLAEFERAQFGLVFWRDFFALAPRGTALFKYALPREFILDRGLAAKVRRRLGSGRKTELPPALAALERSVPAVGGEAPVLPANAFIPLDADEAALDYPFLARAGIEVPLLKPINP